MKTAINQKFADYASFLRQHAIAFAETDIWLQVGNNSSHAPWLLHLTASVRQLPDLLQHVLPLLAAGRTPFRLVKNELLHYQINAGRFGNAEVGKTLTLFPQTEQEAVHLFRQLEPLTRSVQGPAVSDAYRLSEIVYAEYATGPFSGAMPFAVAPKYRRHNRNIRLIAGKYVPYRLIHRSFKGDIFLAINLRGLSFSECLIKQGRKGAVEDQFGRTMFDRLQWQKTLQEQLAGVIPVPRVLDLVTYREDSYLVMEYVEGNTLRHCFEELRNGLPWTSLAPSVRQTLLLLLVDLLSHIAELHRKHIAHRDINDRNFLVDAQRKVIVIDFEMACDVSTGAPSPAFIMGTPGFVAPEQLVYREPSLKEDIYSLGVLFVSLITSVRPRILPLLPFEKDWAATFPLLGLVPLLSDSLSHDPDRRPTIFRFKEQVQQELYRQYLEASSSITTDFS